MSGSDSCSTPPERVFERLVRAVKDAPPEKIAELDAGLSGVQGAHGVFTRRLIRYICDILEYKENDVESFWEYSLRRRGKEE